MEPVLSGWSLGHPWYLGGYNRPTGRWRGPPTIYYISNIRLECMLRRWEVVVCYIWPVQAAGPCLMEPVMSGWSLGHPWYLGGYNRPAGRWRGPLTIYYISNIRPCSTSRFTRRGSNSSVWSSELKNAWQFGEDSEV